MSLINRAAVISKPKQPFIDWLKSLPDPLGDKLLTFEDQDFRVYLVPGADSNELIGKRIYGEFEFFFEDILEGWWKEEKDFPQNRSLNMFKEWFIVEVHSLVEDLVDGLIESEGD